MSKPQSFQFRPTTGLVLAVSSKLYRDPATMVGELVINGLDAAMRRGVEPVIEVCFWQAGEHPFSPEAPVLTVVDNGSGFTKEVIADYIVVGESVYCRNARYHGTHGIGKFAAFGLSGSNRFQIITRPQGRRQMVKYSISAEDVFSGQEIKAETVSVQPPGLPAKDSFACILVRDFNGSIGHNELCGRLAQLLPIRPCQVIVQGVPVILRQIKAECEVETPPLPTFANEKIRIRFAVVDVTGHHDQVRIFDAVSGRPVASFDTLLPSVRRRLESTLLHPQLQGEIWVPGNLEKHSETGRVGIVSEYWRSEQGEVLITALNVFGAPLATKLVGSETKSKWPIQGQLGEVATLFNQSFGAPDTTDDSDPDDDDKPAGPDKPPRPGGKGGDGTKKGDGKKRKKGVRPPQPTFGGVLVKVEDSTYTVMSFNCSSDAPGHVRSGNVIVINTSHPEIGRLQKLSATRVREALARYITEAHVASRYDAGTGLFGRVYQILGRLCLC